MKNYDVSEENFQKCKSKVFSMQTGLMSASKVLIMKHMNVILAAAAI